MDEFELVPQPVAAERKTRAENNKLQPQDRVGHDWYRFVLSFPPHLVQDYVRRFDLHGTQTVLDPFCGTGTTLVECKKMGIASIGIETNPMAHFAGVVKTDWTAEPNALLNHATEVAAEANDYLAANGRTDDLTLLLEDRTSYVSRTLPPEKMDLLLTDSISPLPLHKTLVLLEFLQKRCHPRYSPYERLALARALVTQIGNLHFGPEVGVGPAKPDAPVISAWLSCVHSIVDDLRQLGQRKQVPSVVHHADSRQVSSILEPESIDAVITSPPYPNEKDYTRTTRLESVLLGFINNKAELQALKRNLLRSNTRGVYKGDDDDQWVAEHPEIQRIADAIEARRIELGKTSGFERLYARVTKLYFGGMARHLAELRSVLRPGAQLAYVVGDQASYLRIMIRTGQLLADIAQSLGYELIGIDLFRTRLATATKEQLREEVVVLRWPGVKYRTLRSALTGFQR
jgi:DNA modification methylase